MDVHYSSGVYNRAFFLLANTPGWSVKKAFDVYVLANQIYWKPLEDFETGLCGLRNAANDLGYNIKDLTTAFSTVGVIGDCGEEPPPPPEEGTELKDGDIISDLESPKDKYKMYYIDVPSHTSLLYIKISKGTGDADLYTKWNNQPTRHNFDCRPYRKNNDEICAIQNPKLGRHFVMIHAYDEYKGVRLIAQLHK